ncbi:MAG: hypothetical protein H6831_05685 [Planctomycetes bacterium]|nr:hypothetical protein [Planctomycetota bacterium]MCB9903881.1 hypothetical protein [Planctomycetota bacterium]
MKLIKRLLIAFVILLLIAVGGVFLLLEPAVVAVVEKGGTHALGVETRLASARVGVLSGEFGLSGLSIDNPPGFEAPHFLDMGETSVDVKMGTLTSDRIEIPRVLISGVNLVIERNANGTNYNVILEHLESLSGPESGEQGGESGEGGEGEEPESEAGPDLVIDEIVLRDISSEIRVLVIGDERRTIPIKLPEITIRNLGGEDGAKVDVVYSKLIEELLAAVVAAGGDQLPADLLNDLQGGLESFGREKLDEQTDKLREKVNETLGAESAESIEKAAKGALDIFKKD